MTPHDCPRFERCSAPVCPLDADWRLRRHLMGERTCIYLLAASKNGGRLPQRHDLTGKAAAVVSKHYPAIEAACAPIRHALKRAAAQGPCLGVQPASASLDHGRLEPPETIGPIGARS